MGSNNYDELMISGSHEADNSSTSVEIKIKTLDSQTYTLRVDKCVPVPALKEQIASVTGVVSEQQRLICRGRVLKDDQLLSAYHVEDGHTLHLVVRQPLLLPSESVPGDLDSASSEGHSSGGRIGTSIFLGTFSVPEQGDGNSPDLSRVVSAVLRSLGITNAARGHEAADVGDIPRERISRVSGTTRLRNSNRRHQATATNAQSHSPNVAPFQSQTATPPDPPQSPVLDSLTTLSQYLSLLRREFAGGDGNGSQAAGASGLNTQDSHAEQQATGVHSGLPGPSSLMEVMSSTRELLVEEAAACLSHLSRQLEEQGSLTEPSTRVGFQRDAFRSGVLLQNLGALLLELGRTIVTMRLSQTSAGVVINAGPAVFISPSGPNPLMVQPSTFLSGRGFGTNTNLTAEPSSNSSNVALGSGFLPRNIDIRIRAGSLSPSAFLNQREQQESRQSPEALEQTNPAAFGGTGGANSVHQTSSRASGAPSSNRESEVRSVPMRAVVAAIPALRRMPSASNFSPLGLLYPIAARVHGSSRNLNSDRSHQMPRANSSNGLAAERLPNSASDGQQRSRRSPRSNGNDHSSQRRQRSQGFLTEILGRLDQLLRAIFPGAEIHVGDDDHNSQSYDADTEMTHAATGRDAADSQEEESGVGDEGIFLSNAMHRNIPFMSQNAAAGPDESMEGNSGDRPIASREDMHAQSSDAGTSDGRADPPSPPSAKRQKRE